MPAPFEDFVFLTGLYDVQWASHRFYADMQARIRRVVERSGHTARQVTDLTTATLTPRATVVIDPAAILRLYARSQLERLLDTRFILILGESPDRRRRTFLGWGGPYRRLTFRAGNLLHRVIRQAVTATWQDEATREILRTIRGTGDAPFFPIDGYRPEDVVVESDAARDIDILLYGSLSYRRRQRFIMRLLQQAPDLRIAVCQNVFDVNDLLRRSKIVVHVNSLEGCGHIPYAKIMKPLANHKILFVEHVDELERSDLRPFVQTFTPRRFGAFLEDVRATLRTYPAVQATLDALNPRRLLQERYDFEANARRLLQL
ncbi:MAG TPA: hypothetical protein VG538_13795 [Vicinamibacterales bacterium]|nr:hypothetical protein [Vicinamibacterales bacterium]